MAGQQPQDSSSQEGGANRERGPINIQDFQFSFQVASTAAIEPDVRILFRR